jgi:hypothetical protein
LGTFLIGIVIGTVNLVPCVGWLAPVIVGLVGLGAAVITLFGTRAVPAHGLAVSPNPTASEGALPPTA